MMPLDIRTRALEQGGARSGAYGLSGLTRRAHTTPEPDMPPPQPEKEPPPDEMPMPDHAPIEEPTPPRAPVKDISVATWR